METDVPRAWTPTLRIVSVSPTLVPSTSQGDLRTQGAEKTGRDPVSLRPLSLQVGGPRLPRWRTQTRNSDRFRPEDRKRTSTTTKESGKNGVLEVTPTEVPEPLEREKGEEEVPLRRHLPEHAPRRSGLGAPKRPFPSIPRPTLVVTRRVTLTTTKKSRQS